jgi:hypothetical protein
MELSLTASLLLLLICLLPLVYFFYLQLQVDDSKTQRHDHGLKVYPILGTTPHFIKNRHRLLEWSTGFLQTSPAHTMSFKVLGHSGSAFTANPANVEHILKTNFENYPKGELADMLDDFLGRGIFNSDGEEWLQQRKTASYELNKLSLRNFVVHAVRFEVVERLLPLLSSGRRGLGATLWTCWTFSRASPSTTYAAWLSAKTRLASRRKACEGETRAWR